MATPAAPATMPTAATVATPAAAAPTGAGQMGINVQGGAPVFTVAKKPANTSHRAVVGISIFLLIMSILLFIVYAYSVSKRYASNSNGEDDSNASTNFCFWHAYPNDWFRFAVAAIAFAILIDLIYIIGIAGEY